jgi:hypothetical protein
MEERSPEPQQPIEPSRSPPARFYSPNAVRLATTGPTNAEKVTRKYLSSQLALTTVHNNYYYQTTLDNSAKKSQPPTSSPLHRAFLQRRIHGAYIDLGVLSLEEVVEQASLRGIISQELFA